MRWHDLLATVTSKAESAPKKENTMKDNEAEEEAVEDPVPVPAVAVEDHQVHTILLWVREMECLLMVDLDKDKVKDREMAKAAKAARVAKEKEKVNLVAKAENAQLVMAQVWDQAPAQTMVAKVMVLTQEIPQKVILEIAQETQEAILMDLVHPVEALQVKMDKAHHPKCAKNVMAQAVKHP
jgi:hypothetical protein